MGLSNCQNWVAGVVSRPGSKGLLEDGDGRFWGSQVGLSGDRMGERCLEMARSWIPSERKGYRSWRN